MVPRSNLLALFLVVLATHRIQALNAVYEAESGTLIDVNLNDRHTGYEGTGYGDYADYGGGTIQWTHSTSSATTAAISIRYATKVSRPLDLYIDGSLKATFSCSGTGSWTTWQTETQQVPMGKGSHLLELTAPNYGPNVDWLSVDWEESSTSTPTQSPTAAPTPAPTPAATEEQERTLEYTVYQAEDAQTHAVDILNKHSGYEGSGYGDYKNVGSYLTWTLSVPSQAQYDLTIRYSSKNQRNCSLYVDGSRQGLFQFYATGSWTTWASETISVSLSKGNHDIKILAEESTGPNIDYLAINGCVGCGSSPTAAPVTRPTPAPVPSPTQAPVPSPTLAPISPTPRPVSGKTQSGTKEFPYAVAIASNNRLEKGEFVSSPSNAYKVGLTNSGSLVLQDSSGSTIWSSETDGEGHRAYVQGDGNMIIRKSNNKAVWTSETYDHAGAQLIVDDAGRIAVAEGYDAVWLDGLPRGSYNGPPSASLEFPIRAMFYYPWYPETWTVNGELVHHIPDLGLYSNSDKSVIENHIDAFEYAWTDMAIASWWGPETNQERGRLTMMLEKIADLGSSVKLTAYHEQERYGTPSASSIKEDLDYLKKWYAWHEGWAHVDDRPVIFVYNSGGCDVARRWMEASNGEWYVVLKLFPKYLECSVQPDHWHQYGVAGGEPLEYDNYSFTIAPGFWRADHSTPTVPRVSKSDWCDNVEEMVASNQPWQLIVSFNEHGEGTGVESSSSWASSSGYGDYLDCLHQYH
eukprot:Nitzschia sp. Nitz4//scaffold50_size126154//27074//29534//NITZ4_003673-RA/size126154-processed-gene-0.32-mRNA-1//1//CDS//3329553662//8048//frame0